MALFRFFSASILLTAASCAPNPAADPPLQRAEARANETVRQGPNAAEIQRLVEQQIAVRYGAETLRQAQAAPSSIMVADYQGNFGSGGPTVNVLTRSPRGWAGWRSGRSAPLSASVAAEVNRLINDAAF
jgi:hypothetical protein